MQPTRIASAVLLGPAPVSNLFESHTNNPYASSLVASQQQPPSITGEFPKFCTTMFVISLIFSILRILSTGFSILGILLIASQAGTPDFMVRNAVMDVVTGAGMMLSGIIGNSLMLARKPVGLYFGYLLVFFVFGSFLVAMIQAVTLFNAQGSGAAAAPQQVQLFSMVIGAGVAIIFRLALVVAYVVALLKFKQWCDVNR